MKKLLVLLLSATAAVSTFAFGCKGGSDQTNGQHGNTDIQQKSTQDENICPDENSEDTVPEPEVLPHMPKKRKDKLPPRPEPMPTPPPHKK